MHIALVTAGGAGMFCGSCMHDNTWARALKRQGARVTLLPAYTPLRLDEHDESTRQVFLGGINVYLDERLPLWNAIPRAFTRWLDHPAVIRLATRIGVTTNAQLLGELTLAMLAGESGPQSREIGELADFFSFLSPDAIIFSNALLAGSLRSVRRKFSGTIFCVLQGDDVFLEDLPESFRVRALQQISERAQEFDGFFVHSRYYRDFMADYLKLPIEKFHVLPLGIELEGHDGQPQAQRGSAPTVGYFARVCPEKGLHQLVDAFRIVHRKHPGFRLRAAGYLGGRDRRYFRSVLRSAADLGSAFEYAGSPATHRDKVAFLKSLDVLCVPTVYREPKGLYVLEALANGVPAVQPRHGAFPELLESTGGGLLFEPGDIEDLAETLIELLRDPPTRIAMGTRGQSAVRTQYDDATLARRTLEILARTSGVRTSGFPA